MFFGNIADGCKFAQAGVGEYDVQMPFACLDRRIQLIQIGEIGELTAEIEKLKDGSKKRGGGREGENSAALEGSSQAAELILKGSATSNPNKKMEQLLQQSVTIQTQIASRDPIELDVEEVNV